MSINYEENISKNFLFFHNNSTKTKQESAEDFLAFQREQVFNNDNKTNVYSSDGVTKTYNDQESINKTLFDYADSNSDGTVDEQEYKTFLMKSVSDGTVCQETYNLVNGLTQNGTLSQNDSTNIIADYENLVKISDLYCRMLDTDSNIDQNNDGLLSPQEFANSSALTLTTNSNEKIKESLYRQDSMSDSEKIKIMSQLSNGIVGNIYSTNDFKYTLNYLTNQYEMCYVPTFTAEPDYNSLIKIADKYHQQISE